MQLQNDLAASAHERIHQLGQKRDVITRPALVGEGCEIGYCKRET